MSLLFTTPPSLFFKTSKPHTLLNSVSPRFPPQLLSLSFPPTSSRNSTASIRASSSSSGPPDPPSPPPSTSSTKKSPANIPSQPSGSPASIPDEWGEKTEPEPVSSFTKFTDPDPPKDEDDEWGTEGEDMGPENGSADVEIDDGKKWELKRCLVDSVYGSDFGFRASSEVRAEVLELINQLESVNPYPNPTEAPGLLDGNWVLLYTAFSELLPLLAVGVTPLLKVERISQSIDTSNSTIENSTTLSSPLATFSFSASATFEVRSPSRIQVQFREGSFKPPEIKSQIDLPENVDIFGQKINLSPIQQFLNPVQEAAVSISRALSGLQPLRVPIPGERSRSWLITTYLDDNFRISRGDGGLFVLAREGSPLLDQ
ncbi:hypothetical protein Nepgr_011030 [Nepenthes gracilis]|uniref:Plastid lipid-associated protein/fibrillin conserved domain-containing protein n=1 Tax=Nepenthes gracilis TaxID=150966 RepID=A0AAD3SED0_NEPGR|nr:hypothetical protein Nepgr_011030 [Nepenthes gracilis]